MTENQTRRDMLERNYAKAANALQALIEEEGCCNALKPFSDALDEIKPRSGQESTNLFYMRRVLEIVAGLVDIDFEETTNEKRLEKIDEAIRFLHGLRSSYDRMNHS